MYDDILTKVVTDGYRTAEIACCVQNKKISKAGYPVIRMMF